ncbi:MAG: hypothetical protein QNJ63_31135, partial [Calothrix sp. MO_192.B10]|nr:hypothetical protein [Calothrix sp. MO_192.B10]
RHLLYAGEPVHRSGLPSTAVAYRPPQWLTVHRSGLPSTAVAYRPPQVFHRNGVAPQPTIYANFGFENTP